MTDFFLTLSIVIALSSVLSLFISFFIFLLFFINYFLGYRCYLGIDEMTIFYGSSLIIAYFTGVTMLQIFFIFFNKRG